MILSSRIAEYEAPDPSRFAPPPNRRPYASRSSSPQRVNSSPPKTIEKVVSEEQYNRLLYQYNSLEQKYKFLEQKCSEL